MRSLASLIFASLLIACCRTDGPPLLASELEITAAAAGTQMSAAYLALTNNSDTSIVISRVSSPQYGAVELHETIVENDIARMRPVAELLIEPGGTVRLERGGKHLMLMRAGNNDDVVTLNFYSGDMLLLSISARPGTTAP